MITQELDPTQSAQFLLGSPQMCAIRTVIESVADTDATVLIRGESGVRKDLVARAIHAASGRRHGPFVKVNCAAISRELLESELFGHEKAAFTGAHRRKSGQFEYARKGTIYLNEIAELALALQAKLLHVLQDFRFSRVGGHDLLELDARLIAATNCNLAEAIARGEFRQDLYDRLNVVEIRVPSLRERCEEIPELSSQFVARFNAQFGRHKQLTPETLARLMEYPWPGNIRELEHVMRRLVVLGDDEQVVETLVARGRNGRDEDCSASRFTAARTDPKEIGGRAAREAERTAFAEVRERTTIPPPHRHPAPTAMRTKEGRISELDGIRGLAILLVLIYHYFYWGVVSADLHPVLSRLRTAMALTWSGVDLFFVLSGFLIAGILIDHRETSNYYRVFYLRRACRILPAYFLILVLFASLRLTPLSSGVRFGALFDEPMPLWSYATFTQNFLMGVAGHFGAGWLSSTWSLAIEEQFYLFIPLLIRWLPGRSALSVFVVVILASPLLRSLFAGFERYVYTLCHGDALLLGACLAFLARRPAFLTLIRGHRRALWIVFSVLLGGTALMTLRHDLFGVFDFSWLAALYSSLIVLALVDRSGLLGLFLNRPLLVWLGTHSYSIYLIHMPAIGLLYGFFKNSAPRAATLSDIPITGLALVSTFTLAAISYRYLERPILRFGHRINYKKLGRHSAG